MQGIAVSPLRLLKRWRDHILRLATWSENRTFMGARQRPAALCAAGLG
jgi:hypothetical protein